MLRMFSCTNEKTRCCTNEKTAAVVEQAFCKIVTTVGLFDGISLYCMVLHGITRCCTNEKKAAVVGQAFCNCYNNGYV